MNNQFMNYLFKMNYFRDFMNNDLVNVLGDYLELKDYYKALKLYDPTDKILNNIIINKILNKLKIKFADKYDNVIEFMKTTDCHISGSFILQCILDEDYQSSDIDFFLNKEYMDTTKELCKSWGISGHNIHITSMEYSEFIMSQFIVMTIYPHTGQSNIFQFILLSEESSNHIIKSFDLDILSNYITYKNGNFVLYIENIDNIFGKIMKIKYPPESNKIKKTRLEKYQSRGFKFTDISYLGYIKKLIPNYNIYKCQNKNFEKVGNEDEKISDLKGIKIECNNNCHIKKFFNKNYKHIHVISQEKLKSEHFNGYWINSNPEYADFQPIMESDIIVYIE